MLRDALPALLAAAVAAIAGFGVRRLAWRIGALDRPDGALKTHARPVPVLGGFALAAGVAAGLAPAPPRGAGALLAAAAGFLVLGAIDDRRPLGPGVKLTSGFCLALGWIVLARPYGSLSTLEGVAAAGALVAIANATNLVDVADALCASLLAISALGLALLLARIGDVAAVAPALALAGAAAGFLWHNRPPARLYLGDGGSLFGGFLLGHLALRAWAGADSPSALARVAPLLLVAVPLLDAAVVSVLRIARGQSPLRGSPDHLAHQLRRAGAGDREVVVILVAAGIVLALLGLVLADADAGPGAAA